MFFDARFILLSVVWTVIATLAAPPAPVRAENRPTFDLRDAIAKAGAGQTLHVPAGIYDGPIHLEKSIKLVADGNVVIEGSGEGNIITITAPDVSVTGFTLRRTGIDIDHPNAGIFSSAPRATIENNRIEDSLFGIYLNAAAGSVIHGNTITGKLELPLPRRGDAIRVWYSDGVIVESNTVTDCRDLVLWYSNELVVRRNRVSRGRYGLHFMYAGHATVEENVLSDNSVGVFLMYSNNLELNRNMIAHNRGPSGFGLGLKDMDGVDCHDNALVDNRVGIHMDNSPSRVDIRHRFSRNVIAFNDIGIGFMPSVRDNDFTANSLLDNIEQVAVFGGGHLTGNSFTVDGVGNYWSDYRGYDAAGDGIGDVPHHSQSVFENLMDREPNLRLFLFSPAQQAVELASRAFPIVKPEVRASDTAPLMRPVKPRIESSTASAAWSPSALAASGLLVVAGLGIVVAARKDSGCKP